MQTEAPAEQVPFDHGRFEILVEDEDGRLHGQDIFARDDFLDLTPNFGAALGELVLCEVCDRFFYESEPECPHCHAREGVSTPRSALEDAGVSTARRTMHHVTEIERILQRVTDLAGREGAPTR